MLELKNVSYFRDNKQILDNISLKIDNSKLVAITGPNGSGKSTLAKIIMGLFKPDSGQILFGGQDITNLTLLLWELLIELNLELVLHFNNQ